MVKIGVFHGSRIGRTAGVTKYFAVRNEPDRVSDTTRAKLKCSHLHFYRSREIILVEG
jgi:hypothetical protein